MRGTQDISRSSTSLIAHVRLRYSCLWRSTGLAFPRLNYSYARMEFGFLSVIAHLHTTLAYENDLMTPRLVGTVPTSKRFAR